MDPESDITLRALKFMTGESNHVCRLCFASTEKEEVSIEDIVTLQRPYLNETLTFVDMFHELDVSSFFTTVFNSYPVDVIFLDYFLRQCCYACFTVSY